MRVLWLGHNLAYPPKGGALQRNYNLLREAAKRCEVHVLAFDQPATRPTDVGPEDCIAALQEFCARVNSVPLSGKGFNAHRYWLALRGFVWNDPFAVCWLRSREMMENIRKTLNARSFDVVHFDTLGLAQYRHLVQGSGTILNHHDLESSMIGRRATSDPNLIRRHYWRREATLLRQAEQNWCPRFGVNLVVSREEENLLTESLPGIRTMIVPNGVDTSYFRPRPDPGGRTLLFCGSLDLHPNRDGMKFFFEAIWPRLTRRLSVDIYVLGRRPPKWLQRLSAVDDRIHVPGFVDDVRPYFSKAAAYVCPINDGGGTRLKILDTLAMGVPLIATSFACSGLGLQDGRHMLLAETPEEFVNQIERVLSDATLRSHLATAGRDIVERIYSWSVIGESLIEAYKAAWRTGVGTKMKKVS